MTPEEAWSGSKPCVKHLRVFGCLCFKHVPDQLRRKLDKKDEQMIILGYHSTGGYRLYDCSSKKVVISSDVIFDESRSLNWENTIEDTGSRQQELKIDELASESASDYETTDHETLVHTHQNL